MTPAKPPSDEDRVAEWVESIFTNGLGHKADRLVLLEGGRDQGGWCREAIRDRALALVHQVRAEASQEKEAEIERLKAQASAAPVDPQAWWKLSDENAALREENARLKGALRDILEDAGDGGTINRGLNSVQQAEALLAEPATEKEGDRE